MMIVSWLRGIVLRRTTLFFGTAAALALTVAFLASLGLFVRDSTASLTARALAEVPVDWQVALAPGADLAAVLDIVRSTGVAGTIHAVRYADVPALASAVGASTLTTGAAKVLGLDDGYLGDFPGEARLLVGSREGVLIAQQTASNLHVTAGDSVTILGPSGPRAEIRIDGVVELPKADSLFQAVGIPAGAASPAPPDNVLVLPAARWRQIFGAGDDAGATATQLHVRIDHSGLAAAPVAATVQAASLSRNLEARLAGSALVADNLGARLDAVREDALYATVVFLFLAAPGAVLAALLTLAVVRAGAARRRQDQALLRLRGGGNGDVLVYAAVEALAAACVGIAAGLLLGALTAGALASVTPTGWPVAAAAAAGLVLALGAMLGEARASARRRTVALARARASRALEMPLWRRAWLDAILLGLGALAYWRSAASGYRVVLAPEGVAAAAVDYTAFLAPLLVWIGLGLLSLRVVEAGLRRGTKPLTRLLAPVAGVLSRFVASGFSREARRLTGGIGLTALAFAFAASTAIFNETYRAQQRVDAALTAGADVTVTSRDGIGHGAAAALSALPEVAGAQEMQHRFAYVGADLQDIYGIDPAHIGAATTIANAYFGNHDAAGTLAELARTPDGVLVSQETINDYQLAKGDTINLRLQGADHRYQPVPFRIVGVALEFPTAPKDSFLVANRHYIGKVTGDDGANVLLLRGRSTPRALLDAVKGAIGDRPGLEARSIDQAIATIGSSLTSVNLTGLTRIELVFALVMIAGSAGLMLALGLAGHRNACAVLTAVGARPRQVSGLIWSEALLLIVAGPLIGLPAGWLIAKLLVKLLTGVFDPPPEALVLPWPYLTAVVAVGVAVVATTAMLARAAAGRDVATVVRHGG